MFPFIIYWYYGKGGMLQVPSNKEFLQKMMVFSCYKWGWLHSVACMVLPITIQVFKQNEILLFTPEGVFDRHHTLLGWN